MISPKLSGRVLLSGVSFASALWFARQQNWAAADIAWSMWLASLVVGYGYIVFVIFIANPVARQLSKPIAPEKGLLTVRIGALLIGLASLGFFTVHFGMFHYVHAMLLDGFLPMSDPDTEEMLSVNIAALTSEAVRRYWPFVLAAGISQAGIFVAAWRDEVKDKMLAPYKAVMKNHLVIMALGFLTIVTPQLNALVFLLMIYFFPWADAWAFARRENPNNIKA